MRVPLIPFILALLTGILADLYILRQMRRHNTGRGWIVAYIVIAVAATLGMLAVGVWPKKSADDAVLLTIMWTLFGYMSIYVPKYIYVIFSLIGKGLSLIFRRPLRGVGIAGGVIAVILFCSMWWGAMVERFRIDVNEVEVAIPDLPPSFDGYRIVQLSDIHTGTYGSNAKFLARVVEAVDRIAPDAVVFTGDIVNRHALELEPFVHTLAGISAPDSVWSIMGNHDYGDYSQWPSPQAKEADIATLRKMQAAMGWHMLNNRHTFLRRGNDSIALIGVENIGDPPFHSYGSLAKAYPTPGDNVTKILLSHNPAHWDDSIAGHRDKNIALTLSGHTHAMQMEVAGLSPAVFRYPTWGGLYTDSIGQALYVNIGIGTVGFPARIGATPEITVITLRKKTP